MPVTDTQQVAAQCLQVIPLVMRAVASDMRQMGQPFAPPHFRLMRMLHDQQWRLTDLAERLAVSNATMSNTISALEARGWVQRQRSEDDRREVLIGLTPEGQAVLEEAHRHMVERLAEALQSLTPDRLERLRDGLAILQEVFEGQIGPFCHPHQQDRSEE